MGKIGDAFPLRVSRAAFPCVSGLSGRRTALGGWIRKTGESARTMGVSDGETLRQCLSALGGE